MRKILLVEDDISLGKTLSEQLRKEYDVFWSKTSSETLQVYTTNKNFDLVILDVGLPDGDGFLLAEKIKALSP